MNTLSTFSDRLSELMFENNDIKSEHLADKIDVSGATIRRWLLGNQQISLTNLLKLSNYFNCSLQFLSGKTDKKLDFTPKIYSNFYDNFRTILKEQKITRYRFTKETRFKDQYFTKSKNGSVPNLQTLIEIADYIDCTIDYLVGIE